MIDPEVVGAAFPFNVVKCLKIVIPGIDPDVTTYLRPLRPTDPNYAVGIYGTLWQPEEESQEIGRRQPTLNMYQVGIQTLIKDGDTERGLTVSSILTNRIRSVIYRNQPLHVALGSLYFDDASSRESFRRFGIRSQRLMSNDIEGSLVTISTTDLWIETEMS